MGKQQGFGGFGLLLIVAGILGVQWMAIAIISSIYVIQRKKQRLVKIAITRIGLSTAITFTAFLLLLWLPRSTDIDSFSSLMVWGIGFLEVAPFLFVFGYFSGSGIAAFMIFMLDVITTTLRLMVKTMGMSY